MPKRTNRVGRHLPTSGGLARTLWAARELGCETIQIFVSNPQAWADPRPRQDADTFVEGSLEIGISPVVAHAKYLINLASTSEEKGLGRLVEGLGRARERAAGPEGGAVVAAEPVVENSVGAGTQLCSTFEDLGEVARRGGVRVCVDTAHAFVTGYDFSAEGGGQMVAEELGEFVGE